MSDTWDLPESGDGAVTARRGGAAGKGLDDYLRAFRRRWWVALLIALLVGGGGTAFTLWQPKTYRAASRVRIEPPRALMDGVGGPGRGPALENFFNTRLQMIASRSIAQQVMRDLKLSEWDQLYGVDDPVGELAGWILVQPVRDSNIVEVSLEGHDPQLVAEIVNKTVETFKVGETAGLQLANSSVRTTLNGEIDNAEANLKDAQDDLAQFRRENPLFLADDHPEAARLTQLQQSRQLAAAAVAAAKRQVETFRHAAEAGVPMLVEGVAVQPQGGSDAGELARLRDQLAMLDEQIETQRRTLQDRYFRTDQEVRLMFRERQRLKEAIADLGGAAGAPGGYDAQSQMALLLRMVATAVQEEERLAAEVEAQKTRAIAQQQVQNRYDTLVAGISGLQEQLATLRTDRHEAEKARSLTAAQIEVIDLANIPTMPVRPVWYIQIPLFVLAGLFVGCLAVVGLEVVDGRVRSPEQLAGAVDWPLLGVVPLVKQRQWTTTAGQWLPASEAPGTAWHEAFRSIRAAVAHSAADDRPMQLVLVSSARPGDGKSVVAANLAAACGRAGEQTLLIDLNLREPALGDFFDVQDNVVGLTEVLDGSAPLDKALLQTPVPNLDVMAAGDATGVPLDVLGTAEMRDLLEDLTGRYHRIILDGPALLGMADGRALARFADGTVLVVRSAAQDAAPLRRVQELAAREHLRPIGVVLNGLREAHVDVCDGRRKPQRDQRRFVATARAMDQETAAAAA